MKPELIKAMQVFKQRFLPADHLEDSTVQMTSEEVVSKFQALLGEESIDVNEMAVFLMDNGYSFDYFDEEFLWLFKTSK